LLVHAGSYLTRCGKHLPMVSYSFFSSSTYLAQLGHAGSYRLMRCGMHLSGVADSLSGLAKHPVANPVKQRTTLFV
jgi:hypothetical protein